MHEGKEIRFVTLQDLSIDNEKNEFLLENITFHYSDSSFKCVKLADLGMSFSTFFQEYGLYFTRETFLIIKELKPETINDEFEDLWHERRHKYKMQVQAVFADNNVKRVKISNLCYTTKPCQHEIIIYTNNGTKFTFDKLKTANEIIEQYVSYLNLKDLLHFIDYLSPEQKHLISGKLAEIINIDDIGSIHINWESDTNRLFSFPHIISLTLTMKDGNIKEITDSYLCYPDNIMILFKDYLDNESKENKNFSRFWEVDTNHSELIQKEEKMSCILF